MFIKITLEEDAATSVPLPKVTDTSAKASEGASLMPSPINKTFYHHSLIFL